MPLTQASLSAQFNWALQNSSTVFSPEFQGPVSLAFSLANLNLTTVNQLYANQITLTGGANQDIDFYSFTNLVGESTGFLHIQSLIICPTGTSGTVLAPSSANPLTWFFGGTSPTITIPPNGCFLFSIPVGGTLQAVTSTARKLNILDGGSGSVVNVVALGSTT